VLALDARQQRRDIRAGYLFHIDVVKRPRVSQKVAPGGGQRRRPQRRLLAATTSKAVIVNVDTGPPAQDRREADLRRTFTDAVHTLISPWLKTL
jgi:hypothetical protein